ncbi:hypothetical protein A0H81_04567 [Grifola frondosa]|uniref:Uncharacterized protein n=1 Tax=Grifola frondosa TaxID=5627 RepID=A0A1C7MJI6_GRIFR|nr:hypothetical protein A0H81_04567 [Grifola frondosa]
MSRLKVDKIRTSPPCMMSITYTTRITRQPYNDASQFIWLVPTDDVRTHHKNPQRLHHAPEEQQEPPADTGMWSIHGGTWCGRAPG